MAWIPPHKHPRIPPHKHPRIPLTNTRGSPSQTVVGLHRVRYGAVELDDEEVAEGESISVEGDALEWVLSLLEVTQCGLRCLGGWCA